MGALETALSQEPAYFTLERGIPTSALGEFLSEGISPRQLAALPEVKISEQVLNSTYVKLQAKLAQVQSTVKGLEEEVSYLETELQTVLSTLQERQAQLVEAQTELDRLDREIQVLRNSYTTLAAKLQEARIAQAETAEPIRVVEAPVVPTRPIGPNKKMNVAVAGVLGLFLGVLLAFFAHYLEGAPPSQPTHGPAANEVSEEASEDQES